MNNFGREYLSYLLKKSKKSNRYKNDHDYKIL